MTHPSDPVNVESDTIAEHVVTTQQRSADDYFVFRRRFVYGFLGGFISTLLIGALSFILMFNNSQEALLTAQASVEDLTTDVTLLREQLGDAQDQLNEARRDTDELTDCRNAFSNTVSTETSYVIIELTELLNVIASDGDLTTAVNEATAAGARLLDAQNARALYEAAGTPLPCPLTPGD